MVKQFAASLWISQRTSLMRVRGDHFRSYLAAIAASCSAVWPVRGAQVEKALSTSMDIATTFIPATTTPQSAWVPQQAWTWRWQRAEVRCC
jgi:hypothetical protein